MTAHIHPVPAGEFTITNAFSLDAGTGDRLSVKLTRLTETGKHLDVTFHDPDRGQMVTVPADLWDRVVAAVERQREF